MDRLHGIRDRFAGGGSTNELLVTLLGLAVSVSVIYLIALVHRGHLRRTADDPQDLFSGALRSLPINAPQRSLLRRIAAELRLEHPVHLLMSPHLFATHAERWARRTQLVPEKMQATLVELSVSLFGKEATVLDAL